MNAFRNVLIFFLKDLQYIFKKMLALDTCYYWRCTYPPQTYLYSSPRFRSIHFHSMKCVTVEKGEKDGISVAGVVI